MDKRNHKIVVGAIVVLVIVTAIAAVLSRPQTSDLLALLGNTKTALRLKGAKPLLARLAAGKLDTSSAEKALNIVGDHIALYTRATQSHSTSPPRLWWEEVQLAYAIAQSGVASQQAKARFFHAMKSPYAIYVTSRSGQRVDVRGDAHLLTGLVVWREVVITAVDGTEIPGKVRDQSYFRFTAGGPEARASWANHVFLKSEPKPIQSITVMLTTSWYVVPLEVAAGLPPDGTKREHIEQLNKVLKMDSTQHLCTCSRGVTLTKEEGWQAHFPDPDTTGTNKL